LSERDRTDRREPVNSALIHTKGAGTPRRGLSDKRRVLYCIATVSGLFGFSETSTTRFIVQSSIAE
jgi:hypothetical protein